MAGLPDDMTAKMIAAAREALDWAKSAVDDPTRPSAVPFGSDGTWSKHDRCDHGEYHYNDCHECSMRALSSIDPAEVVASVKEKK